MKFTETPLKGAFLIDLEPREDERGMFSRAFCQNELAAHGLKTNIVQCNISTNHKAGTLRGMHFQNPPHAEVKMIRCTRGAIDDVIIDLRKDSPTYLQHYKVRLTAENRTTFYVPEGFAHGYLALEDDTEAFYMVTEFYTPGAESGIRWNDPLFNIDWGITDPILSDKDKIHPDYQP